MRVLITGASGFIGGHLTRALLAQGHQVLAVGRRTGRIPLHPRCSVVNLEFARALAPGDWLPLLDKVDAVINAVGIIAEDRRQRFDDIHCAAPIALFEACREAGVSKVIQISALGADATAFSRYHLSKKAADDFLAASDLAWVILQPSLVYGPGGKSWALLAAQAALPVIPLIGDGQQRIQPVCVDDLTAAVFALLQPNAPTRLRINVTGPGVLTMREFSQHLRRWLGRPPGPTWALPYPLLLRMGDWLDGKFPTPFTGETLRMLAAGNVGEHHTLANLLGRSPLSVQEVSLRWPATSADRWYVRLYGLVPALRYCLACLWIWSGLVSAALYPAEASYRLLAAVGVDAGLAPLALYGASAMDALLGVALLLRYRLRWTVAIQLTVMAVYSLVIALYLPDAWLHPFAPMVKNLPIALASLVVLAEEDA